MDKLQKDLYYSIFEKLSLKDITRMCNINKSFRKFCLENQKFI